MLKQPVSERELGFTLLELMVVLAIVGILVAVAAPSFQSTIRSNQISGFHDSLANAVKMARSEAVNTQSQVTICASTDQASCGGTWADGWIIFQDLNGSTDIDAGERLIEVGYGNTSIAMGVGAGVDILSFLASGMKSLRAPVTLGVCDADFSTSGIPGELFVISAVGSLMYLDNAGNAAGCT